VRAWARIQEALIVVEARVKILSFNNNTSNWVGLCRKGAGSRALNPHP